MLGVTAYGLHRYQTMEVKYQVDRTMPLHPLKGGALPNFPERARYGNQGPKPELEIGEATAPAGNQAAADKPVVGVGPAS